MTVMLWDLTSDEVILDVNFWHWRAIVEAVRRTAILSEARVDSLHEPFIGELCKDEARAVANAPRTDLLPMLSADERLLLDGSRTTEPDDAQFYKGADSHWNYSTDRNVLEQFVNCCESCDGFRVA